MPSNNSLIPSLWAAKRAKPSIAAASVANGITVPHYQPLSPQTLGRILRTSSSNQEGSTLTGTCISTFSTNWMFAVDNNRFIHFSQVVSTNRPCARVFNVTTGTPAAGTQTDLRAASESIIEVKQNPANKLQFAVLGSSGYTYLVTVDASGTGLTVSSHNTLGSITGMISNRRTAKVVWAADGGSFVLCTVDAADGVFALFTVSGTTVTYVGNTKAATLTTAAAGRGSGVSLTGGANNEFVYSYIDSGTPKGNVARCTFDNTAVTVAMQASFTPSSVTFSADGLVTATGHVHTYAGNTSPYPSQRYTLDGSGSGAQATNTIPQSGSGGAGIEGFNGFAPFGDAMFWDVVDTGASCAIFLRGFGVGHLGQQTFYTKGNAGDVVSGFCLSHDYSKALIGHSNGSTSVYAGFTIPTT